MNDMQIFTNNMFGQVRVIQREGEPWFVAADVCKSLEIDTTATRRLDEDEKAALRLTQTSSNGVKQDREVTIVNEPGLYTLVLGSRKPEARLFKRWITHEVIPAIRKTGGYIAGEKSMTDEELMAKALLMAQNKIQQRDERIKALEHSNTALEAKVEADAPKVLFAQSVEASNTSILIGQLAKQLKQNGLDIGQQRLFERLRKEGFLCKSGRQENLPTQRAMEMGLFEIKERTHHNPDGSTLITRTTLVSGKGQVYFTNRYLGKQTTT